MKFSIFTQYTNKPSKRLWLILIVAVLFSIGLSAAMAPTLTVQAGFTPTPIPATPTNTPVPTATPTATPVATTIATEATPLLPETGGTSWFPMVMGAMIALAIAGFGWAGLNRSRETIRRK